MGSKFFIMWIVALSPFLCHSQNSTVRLIDRNTYMDSLQSFKNFRDLQVFPKEDSLALATYIALSYYPELQSNLIKIKYKRNVKYPITASWSFWNLFRSKKNHVFVLLLSANSFVRKADLNRQVGVIGHEFAHFVYYKKHHSMHMIPWGLSYITSKKYRYTFEKEADKTAIDHGLGWQILEVAFYMNRKEIMDYMKLTGYDFQID